MHFDVIYMILFSARSKVIKGVIKGQICVSGHWTVHGNILKNVRFCSKLLHLVLIDELNKHLYKSIPIHSPKPEQINYKTIIYVFEQFL